MKTRYRFAYLAIALVLTAGAAMPRVRTRQHAKAQHQSSTAAQSAQPPSAAVTTPVTGTGTAGQLVKFAGDGTAVANSIVTETKLGNVGVGTTTPGSKLTVQGPIETLSGGYKFPDGTIQTTASLPLNGVRTNQTLTGDGVSIPLGLAVPLVFGGSVSDGNGVVTVANVAPGGTAIFGIGGSGNSNSTGGPGLFGLGGDGVPFESPGSGVVGFGGTGHSQDAGTGGGFLGGFTDTGSGGDGAHFFGSTGFGMGNKGGRGLVAFAGSGSSGATAGLAGQFFGDVAISGSLSKGGGSFKIDHPLDPENKYLYHSFVESPDMMNIYNGTITTDANGEATITMPDWFEALNQDFRYQLTVIGGTFAQALVSQEVKGNSFSVRTSAPNIKVSWQVTGIRHDAYANMHRIPVEEQKPEGERGLLLHPDAFNQPESKGVQFAQHTREMRTLRSARDRARQNSAQ